MIRARQRTERAWALQCAIATAAAQTEAGQEYLETLWGQLRDAEPEAATPTADADEIARVQAQARLDGLVRTARGHRDD